MSREGVVSISADRLLEIADRLKDLEADLRKLGLNGFTTQPSAPRPPRQPTSQKVEPTPFSFDVLNIPWTKSNKAGGGAAGPNTPWCWAYGYELDSPEPKPECAELVYAILQYEIVQCGRYIVKLSGRDMRLLNRTLAK